MIKQFYYKNNRFQQLRGFYYTIQAGSMSKAAKMMNLSHGAVSLQIQSLERDLGVQLFRRFKNKIEITREGKMFYNYSIGHIQGVDELFESFTEYMEGQRLKTVDIAANHVSVAYILPKYVRKFEIANPEVEFQIRNLEKKDAISRLLNNQVDMFIHPMKTDEVPNELEFIPIVNYQPVLLARKEHELINKENLTLQDIKKYELIRMDRKFATVPAFDEVAKAHGLKIKIEFEMGDYEILKKFVKAGVGITIVSNICLEGEEESELTEKSLTHYFPEMTYGILIKKGKKLAGLLKDFIELMRTEKLLQAQLNTTKQAEAA